VGIAAYWPYQSEDIGGTLNRVPKFVVSSTLTAPSWAGTRCCQMPRPRVGSARSTTRCSGVLIRSLLAADVIDRLHLWLYPITLGQGKRLFDAGTIPRLFPPRRAGAHLS
jgi:hypothetical protein